MTTPLRRLHGAVAPTPIPVPERPAVVQRLVQQAQIDPMLWTAMVTIGAATWPVAAVITVFGSLRAGAIVALLGVAGPSVVLYRRRDRRRVALVEAAPVLLLACARELRAGASPRLALAATAGRIPPVLTGPIARVTTALELGVSVERALDGLLVGEAPAAMQSARVALGFALDGDGAAGALEATASSLEAARQFEREVASLTAQVRLSAQVLVVLPLAFLLLGVLVGADQVAVLWSTTAGRSCLGAGLALDGLGWWWLRTQTARATR